MLRLFLALSMAFFISSCIAQVNFTSDYIANNPIGNGKVLEPDQQIEVHEAYLREAIENKDTLRQIYGLFYLFADYFKTNNYVEQKKLVIQAQKLIDQNSKPEWQGALVQRTAYLAEIIDNDIQGAIEQYKNAVQLCKEAKDSLCIAESLEQLSNLNKNINNYELAENYFSEAIVLLEKFTTPRGLALAYNNYALLAQNQDKLKVADEYLSKAIAITSEIKDTFNTAIYLSNQAVIYYEEGRYHEAIKIFHDLEIVNERNSWRDNLMYNYMGLSGSYESIGEYQKAGEYTQKYFELKEALTGAKIRKQIEQLEKEDESNKNELILREKENQLQKSHIIRDRLLGMAGLLSLLCIGLYYFWYTAKRNIQKEKQDHLNYIHDLRKILQVKNIEINSLNQKLNDLQALDVESVTTDSGESTTDVSPIDITDEEYKVFDTRIVNDEGITAFKSYFDKIYPGLLIKVRKIWPDITDAEERLFMLIKLRIKSKEAAEILGISQSSVKKSRYRLRKRLDIESSIDLEQYIQSIK